jgi:hypothetical protein
MMGFTATGRPEFTNHEAHDDPQGLGFAHKGPIQAHDHVADPGEDHWLVCTSLKTYVVGFRADRKHAPVNGVRAC